MSEKTKLWRVTVEIITDYDPSLMAIHTLARQVKYGDVYGTKREVVEVSPDDVDASVREFFSIFEDDEEEIK